MKNRECGIAFNWHCIAVALLFVTIITLLVLYIPAVREFDTVLLRQVNSICPTFPQYILLIIAEIGRYQFLWPLAVSCGILVSHRYYLEAVLLVLFTEGSYVLSDYLKNVVCRERPCGGTYPGYSFPSAHAMIEMCFFGILIYLTIRHLSGFWKYFLITIFALMIFLTCISRLCIGVHFPTDVTAGALIGFILVNIYIIIIKSFNR